MLVPTAGGFSFREEGEVSKFLIYFEGAGVVGSRWTPAENAELDLFRVSTQTLFREKNLLFLTASKLYCCYFYYLISICLLFGPEIIIFLFSLLMKYKCSPPPPGQSAVTHFCGV